MPHHTRDVDKATIDNTRRGSSCVIENEERK